MADPSSIQQFTTVIGNQQLNQPLIGGTRFGTFQIELF
jgi:hypothetical protein